MNTLITADVTFQDDSVVVKEYYDHPFAISQVITLEEFTKILLEAYKQRIGLHLKALPPAKTVG